MDHIEIEGNIGWVMMVGKDGLYECTLLTSSNSYFPSGKYGLLGMYLQTVLFTKTFVILGEKKIMC